MSDGRQNPRRLRVAPPPGGKRPGDWLNLRVVTTRTITAGAKVWPPGSAAVVFIASHGGSGMAIRFGDNATVGRITHNDVRLADV